MLLPLVSLDNVAYILKRSDFATLNPVKFFILRGNDTLYGYMPVSMETTRQDSAARRVSSGESPEGAPTR